ncbi:MAG: hypothetical protein CVU55_13285 [Deltaproteobacteria bacterium HGW-Deltaproteobacteria-13]|jgi:hypothetical protein|nr:MAG: hypothetical protein CVU55_13285 [Deltaproteobacteria bacterium HGW-Deltaproteobacteria-13]
MSKRIFLSFALAAIFGLSCLISPATAAEKQKDEPSGIKASTRQPAASHVNNITQTAVTAGALSCASRINQVANFLTAGSQNVGVLMFLTPNHPDKQLFSVSMEIPLADASAYASASFAPNQANGCGGMYETVSYWPQKCTELAGNNFGTLKIIGTLSKDITVLNGGELTKIFLMPAGKGCVSIKKEMIR